MSCGCGCCGAVSGPDPANRPGLPSIAFRAGTYASFLEAMTQRLSSRDYPELAALRTRAPSDPAMGLIDVWSIVADVLTFYQERIANEGYLRTATERRSILELARLVGYELRPGVAATAYLAYTIDEDRSVTPPGPVKALIPAGSRAQSVPGPGELPQSFETSDELEARSEWNGLRIRATRPQTDDTIRNVTPAAGGVTGPRVYLKGNVTLERGDPLLVFLADGRPSLFMVTGVQPQPEAARTLVRLRPWPLDLAAIDRQLLAAMADPEALARVRLPRAPSRAAAEAILGTLEPRLRAATSEERAREAMIEWSKEMAAAPQPADPVVARWLSGVVAGVQRTAMASSEPAARPAGAGSAPGVAGVLTASVLSAVAKPPSLPPANAQRLDRSLTDTFTEESDAGVRLLGAFRTELEQAAPVLLANAKATGEAVIRVFALRQKAALFGASAPLKQTGFDTDRRIFETAEWDGRDMLEAEEVQNRRESAVISLDADYSGILPGSWVVLDASAVPELDTDFVRLADTLIVARVRRAGPASRASYGVAGKVTRIELATAEGKPLAWLRFGPEQPGDDGFPRDDGFAIIRRSAVFAKSEELALADEPIPGDVCDGGTTPLELEKLYSGLQSGRWLIVAGERTDVTAPDPDDPATNVPVPGIRAAELVMLAGVSHDVVRNAQGAPILPGDRLHTFITLASPLAYCYKRGSLVIHGNVVKATHGETRTEVLGSGDATQAFQSFTLKQPPLTYVAASNPKGVDSTLVVRVDGVRWRRTDRLSAAEPTARVYATRTDDEQKTTVIFGDGRHGMRVTTGGENVDAVYRNGIGKAGNVKAGQITLLTARPLGVKEVVNPIRASGGADREGRDQARQNAPLGVRALDRLVSTRDYADFARTFAGIGKAAAVRITDGQRLVVHVTIAGADDVPIDKTSDLYRNLVAALRAFGDPYIPIQVDVRELLALVVMASIAIDPDYRWEAVELAVRTALLDAFGFQQRQLAQPVFLGAVVGVIQRVRGVSYVDVDVLDSISELELSTSGLLETKQHALAAATTPKPYIAVRPARPAGEGAAPDTEGINPAQLALLMPQVPDTLILREVPR
jgi:uncharacterized phage protein gp47/JayE